MSNWNDDLLTLFQTDVQARLDNDPFFADIPVLEARKGVTENDIQQALGTLNSKGGKMGAVAIVLMPEVEAPEREGPGPLLEIVQSIQVITTPLFNDDIASGGTGKDSESIALNALNLLHRYIPYHLGQVVVADTKPIRPVGADGDVVYLVVVRMRTGLTRVAKVSTPQIDGEEFITLTSGTEGAALYYTIDGSYPGPLNPQAVLYTVPFTIPPDAVRPVRIRVVGYKDDLIASDAMSALISDTP